MKSECQVSMGTAATQRISCLSVYDRDRNKLQIGLNETTETTPEQLYLF